MSKNIKLSPEEKKLKREKQDFKRKIVQIFKNTGFEYLNTENMHRKFGLKRGELDYVFIYENIILVCEDTTTSKKDHIKSHLQNKKLLTDEIIKNKSDTIKWLKEKFPEKFDKFQEYNFSRYQIFHLYFTKNKLDLSDEDIELYSPIVVVELSSLNYFHKITQNIKYSARNEIFRLLNISLSDLGVADSSCGVNTIDTTIIYPEDNTGLKNGVRMVSFMISAERLMKCCYVLRKDNWEDSTQLYQRLIEKSRIQGIRKYLATHKTTFFNNIIVSLPANIKFKTKVDQKQIDLEDIHNFENCIMSIPNEINSICVIDGQHRIFAHYEGEDSYEKEIKSLRRKLHLLVTGLVFPAQMSNLERRKYESQIFLDINSNAKPVPADVLLHIETLKDPFSEVGIARQALAHLNKREVFLNYFQLSLMEKSKIKIASIIKFALRYLVEITNDPKKDTLYNYWDNTDKDRLLQRDEEQLKKYVKFISGTLDIYFNALKSVFNEDWDNMNSKILSVTSINGFIMALRNSLQIYGVRDFAFYKKCFQQLKVGFSNEKFPYISSQYNKFSKQISKECFNMVENEKGEWQIN